MDEKIAEIKRRLGSGSINIFGAPLSGKDTVGRRLAEDLGAEFLSSGDLLRASDEPVQATGGISPTEAFESVVLPRLGAVALAGKSLVLSSVGRLVGEDAAVVAALKKSDHPLRAVIFLKVGTTEIKRRLAAAGVVGDRDGREDDDVRKIARRIDNFNNRTLPVVENYRAAGLLIEVDAVGMRDEVYARVIAALTAFLNGVKLKSLE